MPAPVVSKAALDLSRLTSATLPCYYYRHELRKVSNRRLPLLDRAQESALRMPYAKQLPLAD